MKYLAHVVTLDLDPTLCNGCGLCVQVCPHAVLAMVQKRAAVVDRDACIECGACGNNCEQDAISVRAGVGCATALFGAVLGRKDPADCSCDCSGGSSDCC